MKLWKRISIFALCLLMALPMFGTVNAEAATKNGLVKKNGNYYYYQNGKKVKGKVKSVTKNGKKYYYYFNSKSGKAAKSKLKKVTTSSGNTYYYYFKSSGRAVTSKWKTVNGHRYYFKSNGRAYQAKSTYGTKYNVTVKTINGTKYGFDTRARAAEGVYLRVSDSKLLYFNKKGSYNSTKSKELQKNLPSVGKDVSNFLTLMNKYEGKPNKKTVHKGDDVAFCAGAYNEKTGEIGQYIVYTYDHLEISTRIMPGSSVETFFQISTI